MVKVSVIIPVYNVETYLEKCLDSVVNQTYKNLEIICVNDCSPDNSLVILEQYAAKDNRIKIINREKNGGLSAARNTGLAAANGEYIYFLDSDDWIDNDYIEKMVNAALKTGMDIVLNTNIIAEYGNRSEPFPWQTYQKKLSAGEFLDNVTAVNDTQCMVCIHLYKKSFLDKYMLKFPEGLIHEDVYFQYVSKINTDKIFAFYGAAYHYLQRNNSIMALKNNRIENLVNIFKSSYEFYKNNNLLEKYKNVQIFRLSDFHCVDNESDFCLIKKYLEYISKDFIQTPEASSDMDKFVFRTISESENYSECRKKLVAGNWQLTYIIRKRQQENTKPKVSVIIPVYNVKDYLGNCLDSVINQTYKNLEIICVNDCSPDNSLAILEQYATKDNRIKIINREKNGGLSAARNTGLAAANGEYIYFLDSDDWIDNDYIEKMVNVALKTGTDIVLNNNIIQVYPDGKQSWMRWFAYEKQLPDGEYIEKFNAVNDTPCMIWAHLYKKSFLDKYNLKFPEGFIHEDVYFQHISKIHTDKIFVFYGPAYYYRQNKSGIVSSVKGNNLPLIKVLFLVYDFYQKNNLLDNDVKLINPMAICYFYTEEEFIKTKQLFDCLSEYFKNKLNVYNDYEQFIIQTIMETKTYMDYCKITNNNIKAYYIRKKLLKKDA